MAFNLLKIDLNNSIVSLMSGKPRSYLRYDPTQHIVISREQQMKNKIENTILKAMRKGIGNLFEEYKKDIKE